MRSVDGEILEIRIDASREVPGLLGDALAGDGEYAREEDLLAYTLLLGFYLETLEESKAALEENGKQLREVYRAMYEDLARVQAAYARSHFSFAESAGDYKTGKMVNTALGREVAATRNHLIPRLEGKRDQLLKRREALLRALKEGE